ncbi:MAG: hypothetical protein C4346_06185 [Chloroflexota bacterium]
MLTGGITLVHAAPAKPPAVSRVALQATPATTNPAPAPAAQPCDDQADEPVDHEEQQGERQDQDTEAQADQQQGDHVDAITGVNGQCEQDDASAAPGTLEDGKDLLSQASITVDRAIAAAQAAAQGPLGTVDLDRENGALVYHVHIGDQEVTVDATTGAVLGIGSDETD